MLSISTDKVNIYKNKFKVHYIQYQYDLLKHKIAAA